MHLPLHLIDDTVEKYPNYISNKIWLCKTEGDAEGMSQIKL